MNPEEFFTAVAAKLDGSAAHRRRALADLRDLLDGGISPEELGDPSEYAAMASHPSGDASVRRYSRVWNPADPSILVPRVVGLGWDINLGAVAVRLGWLRPDDIDADVIGAIPDAALRLCRGLPLVGAALTVAASAAAAARSDGALPSGWDSSFRPRGRSSASRALAPALALSAGAAVWSGLATGRADAISRGVFGTSLAFIGAGAGVLAARSTWIGDRAQPITGVTALLIAPPALSLLAGLVPIRAGLMAVWKEAGLHG